MNDFPFISALTFLPLAGGLILAGLRQDQTRFARALALGFTLAALGLALLIWGQFDPALGSLQFPERHQWIPKLGVEYRVGVDGLSLVLVLLTATVVPMAVLASWRIEERAPLYFSLTLLLQSGLFGTFTAQNFFHWFLFWELSLVPAFFLIRFWGGPRRAAAATQFFVYTMVGSVALLLGFLALNLSTGIFDFQALAEKGRDGLLSQALADKLGWYNLTQKRLALIIFGGVFLGFAVKVPLVPFHSWLPLAYTEAPTGTTMLLTGLMSKMGVYGILRILVPIFPQELRWVLKPLLALVVLSIIFSAAVALAQRDIKRMLAYSSINHLGYCLLGTFAAMSSGGSCPFPQVERTAALNGVLLQMFNHGLTAATLFWFAGLLEIRGAGSRTLDDFGGLRKVAPVFCGLMGVAIFSSLGLPGLNGFVGEFLIFKGAFPLAPGAATISVLGLLITAVFLLSLLQRVFFGPLNTRWKTVSELNAWEIGCLIPAIGLMLLLGIYPQILVGTFNSTVLELVSHLRF
jgi:NADH-quinone oxidoreductase subunit M